MVKNKKNYEENLKLNNIFKKIDNEIKNSKNILVYFDTDADGLTSYIQLKKYYNNIDNNKIITGIPYYDKDSDKKPFFDSLVNVNKYDLIIFLDRPTVEEEYFVENKKIIWIDHHPSNDKKLIKKYNILHFNPLDYNFSYYPVTYWVYKLTKGFNKDIGLIGTISDFFLIDEIIDGSNILNLEEINNMRKNMTDEEILRDLTYNSFLDKFITLYNFVFKLKEEEIYKSIKWLEKLNYEDLKIEFDINKNELINKINKNLEKVNKIIKRALKEKDEKIFYFEYSGKTSFTSIIANKLGYYLKNWKILIICFMNNRENKAYFSIRSQKDYIINKIVSKISKKYGGRGGGHPNASGANIDLNIKDDFVIELKNEFSKII